MRNIAKLVVRVAVDAMILDLAHQFERAVVSRWRNRRKNWGGDG